MKVIGIGAPRTLELRLKCCELGVWREVLREAHAEEQRGSADAKTRSDGPGGRLRELSRLLGEAHAPWRPDQPVLVVGATSVIAPLVSAAALKAMDRYVAVGAAFIDDGASVARDEVRAALDTAGAWTATLLALHRIEHDDDTPKPGVVGTVSGSAVRASAASG